MNIFGIPLHIHWSFFLVFAIFGGADSARSLAEWSEVFLWMVAGFVSITVHELGHALLGRRFGGGMPEITLHGLGGYCTFASRSFNRREEFMVSLAGPAAGLALGVVAMVIASQLPPDPPPNVRFFIGTLVLVNFFWSIFNLLPIIPMDGGHMLDAALGPRRRRITLWISLCTSAFVALAAVQAGFFVMTILLVLWAIQAWKELGTTPKRGR